MNRRLVLIVGALVVVSVLCAGGLLFYIVRSGVTGGIDARFGDQHLKTTVALLELHKVRYGKYPETLGDIKFVGNWDLIALSRVKYTPSLDHQTYYLEVITGWVGKPSLSMPDEFWQGTGYRVNLKPKS